MTVPGPLTLLHCRRHRRTRQPVVGDVPDNATTSVGSVIDWSAPASTAGAWLTTPFTTIVTVSLGGELAVVGRERQHVGAGRREATLDAGDDGSPNSPCRVRSSGSTELESGVPVLTPSSFTDAGERAGRRQRHRADPRRRQRSAPC